MVCLYCSSPTRVINSRPQKRLLQVWRRRACTKCSAVFTTNESIDLATSLAVRGTGTTIRPFSRDKLLVSILQAVGHRKQPVADAAALTATVTAKLLHGTQTAALSHNDITHATLKTLQHFDTAAAVQYAAYHKPSS